MTPQKAQEISTHKAHWETFDQNHPSWKLRCQAQGYDSPSNHPTIPSDRGVTCQLEAIFTTTTPLHLGHVYQLVAPRLAVSEICVTLFHWIVILQYGDVRWSSLLIDYGQPPAANSPTGKRCHNPPTALIDRYLFDFNRWWSPCHEERIRC